MFTIGPWVIERPSVLAPMAGITDLPFRQLCRKLGAGLAVSEMLTSDTRLWQSRKSQFRLAAGDLEPRSIQIVGNDPVVMAKAAKINADQGAHIIDINMGCPAKKVCKKAAGSALLKDENLVHEILKAVVNAVDIPVTLKIRTGWDKDHRNGPQIAKIAEDVGIQALAVHGRTRACAFKGDAEYDTIAEVVNRVCIPVLANGDIMTAQQALWVKEYTGAHAVMIGRGALGNPWLFREIASLMNFGSIEAKPSLTEIRTVLLDHVQALHKFYGADMGSKIARKHVSWYFKKQFSTQNNDEVQRITKKFNRIDSDSGQIHYLQSFFDTLKTIEEKAA